MPDNVPMVTQAPMPFAYAEREIGTGLNVPIHTAQEPGRLSIFVASLNSNIYYR